MFSHEKKKYKREYAHQFDGPHIRIFRGTGDNEVRDGSVSSSTRIIVDAELFLVKDEHADRDQEEGGLHQERDLLHLASTEEVQFPVAPTPGIRMSKGLHGLQAAANEGGTGKSGNAGSERKRASGIFAICMCGNAGRGT